jgi:flagellar M-ring protein FliF
MAMDFVNKSVTQATDLLKSMTPATRITTALLLGVVVLSLVFLFRQPADRADDYLFGGHDLSQAEISAMEAAFSGKGLNAWEVTGNRIRVPRSQRNLYIAAARDAQALPETPDTAWDRMFTGDNPLKSKQIRDLEANRALERSLASTLEEVSGIDVARVQIQEVETGEFPRTKERRCLASVKGKGNGALSARQVESIRSTVAGGGGCKPENVTVMDLNTGTAYPGTGDGVAVGDSLYAKHQRELEDYYRGKILDRLSTYGEVKVAVHVELDKEMVNQTVSDKYEPKPTSLEVTDFSKESTTTQRDAGGRPGVVANAGIGNMSAQLASSNGPESTTAERRENQRVVTGVTRSVTEKIPFVPTAMGVSIGIPRSYFLRVWKQRNTDQAGPAAKMPDTAVLKTIENEIVKDIEVSVNALLPKVAQGVDPFPRVTVTPYTEAPLPIPEGPTSAETAMKWLSDNWQTLGLLLLAGASFLFLRGMLRSPEVAPAPQGELAAAGAGEQVEGESPESETDPSNSPRRFQIVGKNLREELAEMVRDDPDAAANVLQNWIGDAA